MSDTPDPSRPLSFEEAVAAQLEKLRARQKVADANPEETIVLKEAKTWLAVVPFWTSALATRARFPTVGASLQETLQRLEAVGLRWLSYRPVAHNASDASTDPFEFSIESVERLNTLRTAINDRGLSNLRELTQQIGEAFTHASGSVPDLLQFWAELASQTPNASALDAFLLGTVDNLLAKDDSATALLWIEAMRSLSTLLGDSGAATLERAGRRLRRYHRLREDARYLTRFLPRAEYDDAVRALVADVRPDAPWGLHFIGEGGVGKTMLLRHVGVELAPTLGSGQPNGPGASTARIDFDFLNPDYPSRAPALLLDQLAQELRVHDRSGEASRLFTRFDERVIRLHEHRQSLQTGSASTSSAVTLESTEFAQLVSAFANAAARLPQPVLLLLDTCEELARLLPDGSVPENVQATFTILKQLQEAFSRTAEGSGGVLRVIFCGRRPLASSGAGWRLGETLKQGAPPARPELRLVEMRGFTRKEAETYLRDKEGIREDLIPAIIRRCAEPRGDGPRPERFVFDAGERQPTVVPRHNPLQLAQFGAWARSEPNLKPREITKATDDRYIEMRIVNRIPHQGVQAVLPAVALLGRFDRTTLRAAMPDADERSFTEIFEELARLEWIDRQGTQHLEVSPPLRAPMRAYFTNRKKALTEVVRRRLTDDLRRRTLETPFPQLDVFLFEAAVRVLKPDPQRAALWWDEVEARFAAEQAYGWIDRVTGHLLASGNDILEGSSIHAAVLATRAAGLLQTARSPREVAQAWKEVEKYAGEYPTREGRKRLCCRSRLGRIVCRCAEAAVATDEARPAALAEIARDWTSLSALIGSRPDEQMAGAVVAALEAVIELAEREPSLAAVLDPGVMPIVAERQMGTEELRAFVRTLIGRFWVLFADYSRVGNGGNRGDVSWRTQAIEAFDQALASSLSDKTQGRWLDWRCPSCMGERIRLEFARASVRLMLTPSEAYSRLGQTSQEEWIVRSSSDDPDKDRLASATLALRGAESVLSPYLLPNQSMRDVDPVCNSHRAFPPLSVAVAEAHAASGDVDEALRRLAGAFSNFESMAAFDRVVDADRAQLRIIRQMRLRDEGYGYDVSFVDPTPEDAWLLAALAGLDGPRGQLLSGVTALPTVNGSTLIPDWQRHAWWRGVYSLGENDPQQAADSLLAQTAQDPRVESLPAATFAEASWILDRCEAELITNRLRSEPAQLRENVVRWCDEHPYLPLEGFTLALRAVALTWDGPENAELPGFLLLTSPYRRRANSLSEILERLLPLVGRRRAAQVALDEGELLALRLPRPAAFLLDWARQGFESVNDRVGAIVAGGCTVITLARVRRRTQAQAILSQMDANYESLRNTVQSLPPWQSLMGQTADPEEWPREWRPWLVRLRACRLWLDDERGRERLVALTEWVESHYGANVNGRVALPSELDGWLNVEEQALPERNPSPPVSSHNQVVDVTRASGHDAGSSESRLIDFLEELAPADFDRILTRVPGATKWIPDGGGHLERVDALIRYLRSSAGPGFEPLVKIVEVLFPIRNAFGVGVQRASNANKSGADAGQWYGDGFRIARSGQRFTPKASTNRISRLEATVSLFDGQGTGRRPMQTLRVSGAEPYRQIYQENEPYIHYLWRALNDRGEPFTPLILQLDVERECSWVCWEAILTAGSIIEERDTAHFFRSEGQSIKRRMTRWEKPQRVFTMPLSFQDDEMLRNAWSALSANAASNAYHTTMASGAFRRLIGDIDNIRPDVAHLIVSPVETTAGVRLQTSLEERRGSGEALLKVEEIRHTFPSISTCILQAPPVDAMSRTDEDRAFAGLLRLCAAELYSLGVPMVLAIPPLPYPIASDILKRLADTLVSMPNAAEYIRSVDEARNDITVSQSYASRISLLSERDILEVARDLCLYMDPTLLGKTDG